MRVKSILMVCRGNICRSPMAEGFFLHHVRRLNLSHNVKSAGICALVNKTADPNAIKIMKQYEIDITAHRARQVDIEIIRKSELILVMSQSQLHILTRRFPTAKGKTFLLGHWHHIEINDPYMQSFASFEKVYQQIEIAWQAWKTRI